MSGSGVFFMFLNVKAELSSKDEKDKTKHHKLKVL